MAIESLAANATAIQPMPREANKGPILTPVRFWMIRIPPIMRMKTHRVLPASGANTSSMALSVDVAQFLSLKFTIDTNININHTTATVAPKSAAPSAMVCTILYL